MGGEGARGVLFDLGTQARGHFAPEVVDAPLDRQAHDADVNRVWGLVMLEPWHREFIDRPTVGRRPRAGRGFAA